VLIRGPNLLESTRRIDTLVLDKTRTITPGVMTVLAVVPLPSSSRDHQEALRLVSAVERAGEHPIAKAIGALAPADRSAVLNNFRITPGGGAMGVIDGAAVVVGRPDWIADQFSVPLPRKVAETVAAEQAAGRTVVVGAIDGEPAVLFVVGDEIKPTSAEAIRRFRELGLNPVLLTGDSSGAAAVVAAAVGIDVVHADVRPQDKAAVVAELRRRGAVVAMVGDGVNDAPALATADLGLAMGSGADAAIEAADITIVTSDLRAAADAVGLSRATLRVIKQNLFWAFAYNVAALPLAAAGLLNPMIAGAAMALSSIFVVLNSLRLRRFKSAF
jgi:Cu+-exporting ATPase